MEEKQESIISLTENKDEIENLRNRKIKEANANFIKIFKPMYYCGALFCLQKYSVKNDRFTLNSNWNILPCILLTFALVALCVMTLLDSELIFVTKLVKYLYSVIYIQHIFQCVIFCAIQFFLKKDNLKLMSTLQEIYAVLYIKTDVFKNRINLLFPCVLYTLIYCTAIALRLPLDPDWSWYQGVFTYITLLFDFEMINASFILNFLAYNTKRWTQIVQNTDISIGDGLILENLTRIFEKIIDAVGLVQKVYKIMILYHVATGFTQALCYIQMLILWMKYTEGDAGLMLVRAAGALLWVIKCFVLNSALCFCGENVYRRLESAKHAVIYKFYQEDNRSTQKFAKNIVRVCDMKFDKVNACGVFTVDAALPLRLAGVVATYTVVLLQFAFL